MSVSCSLSCVVSLRCMCMYTSLSGVSLSGVAVGRSDPINRRASLRHTPQHTTIHTPTHPTTALPIDCLSLSCCPLFVVVSPFVVCLVLLLLDESLRLRSFGSRHWRGRGNPTQPTQPHRTRTHSITHSHPLSHTLTMLSSLRHAGRSGMVRSLARSSVAVRQALVPQLHCRQYQHTPATRAAKSAHAHTAATTSAVPTAANKVAGMLTLDQLKEKVKGQTHTKDSRTMGPTT